MVIPPSSYGAPVHKPSGSYGAPPLPHYPIRKHGSYTPSKGASYTPFKGLMSALESYLPGANKPKFPPKGNPGFLGPSYVAPNPTYAPLLPSYHSPTPKPSYVAPQPSYVAPKPSYVAPKPSYVAPQPSYVPSKPVHFAQKVDYVAPRPAVHHPYTVTVKESIKPTVIEHHSHTHTHVYKGDAANTYQHDDPYYTQGSQKVFKRQESSSVKSHETDSIQDILNQNHQRQETRVRVTSSVSSSQGGHVPHQTFRPGKIENGFQPMNTVPDTFFRQQAVPTYREDCQCVSASFCSAQNIVLPFTSDIRQFLDARNNAGSDILSNSTLEEEVVTEAPQETVNSIRRGRVLGLSDERVYVSGDEETTEETPLDETVTEEVVEPQTEQPLNEDTETETVTEVIQTEENSRVRRDVVTEAPVEDGPAPADAIPRQGVSTHSTSVFNRSYKTKVNPLLAHSEGRL